MPLQSRHRALVALAIVSLVWSYNWIVMKQALQYSGPFEFSALRYAIGTVILFGLLLLRRESLRPPPLFQTMLVGLTQTMGFQALVQWALVEGGAGKTALLAYTMPFWVVLITWVLLAERPGGRHLLSIVIAAIGLLLVIAPWHGIGGAKSAALAITGGLAWGIGVVLSKRLFRSSGISALSLTAWQMLFGSLGLIVITILVPERGYDWTPFFIVAVAYNAVFASCLAWLLWSYVVERLPTNVAGMSSLVIPLAGIGFAWLILGEQPSIVESLGIITIGVALAVLNVGGRKQVHHD
ncbi:MAG: DMT family transporter [Dokdonella sp.]